jgi:hypothetical protein
MKWSLAQCGTGFYIVICGNFTKRVCTSDVPMKSRGSLVWEMLMSLKGAPIPIPSEFEKRQRSRAIKEKFIQAVGFEFVLRPVSYKRNHHPPYPPPVLIHSD